MYSAIVQDHLSLIRAVKLDADSENAAVKQCADLEEKDEAGMLRVYFLINTDTGDIQRVYSGKDGYKLHKSAYEVLGRLTGQEYFDQIEIQLNLEDQ